MVGLWSCGGMTNRNQNLNPHLSEFKFVHACQIVSPLRVPRKNDSPNQPANGLFGPLGTTDTVLPSLSHLSLCMRQKTTLGVTLWDDLPSTLF